MKHAVQGVLCLAPVCEAYTPTGCLMVLHCTARQTCADLEMAIQAWLAEMMATWRTGWLIQDTTAQLAHELPQGTLLL